MKKQTNNSTTKSITKGKPQINNKERTKEKPYIYNSLMHKQMYSKNDKTIQNIIQLFWNYIVRFRMLDGPSVYSIWEIWSASQKGFYKH